MVRARAGGLALALAMAGCGPSGERTFELEFPADGQIQPLVVIVVDRTGIVEAIGPGPIDAPEGVSSAPGNPSELFVTWLGGMCDHRTTLTVEEAPVGYQIRERTERADSCRLMAVGRSVALQLSGPVNAANVEFVSGTQ